MRILIVEDEDALAHGLKFNFEQEGYDVLHAEDGPTAIDLARDSEPPLNVGHNPLAGLTYLAVFTIYLILIVTGVALYSVSADSYMQWFQWLLPILGGAQTARWIHHIAMWFLLGFVGHHIWSAMLVSRVEGMGLIDSLFSGSKWLPKGWRNRDK